MGTDFTIVCPAFPETGRTIFKGHLFVGDLLLSDTHMRHHPLTPMTDANLVRVLQRQTTRKVGPGRRSTWCARARTRSAHKIRGPARGRLCLCRHRCDRGRGSAPAGYGLRRFGAADRRLGHRHGPARELPPPRTAASWAGTPTCCPTIVGGEVVLAGSCSAATLEQIAVMASLAPRPAARPRSPGGRLAAGRGGGLGQRSGCSMARC